MSIDAGAAAAAEALPQRQNVVGRPADDEGAQDEADGAQRLTGPVLRFGLLSRHRGLHGLLHRRREDQLSATIELRLGGRLFAAPSPKTGGALRSGRAFRTVHQLPRA